MALKRLDKTPADYSKSGFEQYLDRNSSGAPLIWPEGTDPEKVQAWRASASEISKRKASLRPKGGYYATRTTRFIDCLDDQANLVTWKQRMTLYGASQLPVDLAKIAPLDPAEPADKKKLDEAVAACMKASKSELKADLGTALHEALEKYDQGQDMGFIPEEFERGIEEYIRITKDIEMVAVEKFGVNDQYKVAGTLDRLGIFEGRLVVMDAKTSQTIEYSAGKFAMQMALYAHMVEYDPQTFVRTPYVFNDLEVDKEKAYVIHMPSGVGTCDLYEVDISVGWGNVELASQVREYRNYHNRKANKPKLIRGSTLDSK